MITIAPSILSADFANLGRDVQRVREADWLHVDVMDGMFVSNISIGVPVVKSLRKFTDQFLDVHLMIEKPVRYVDAFADAGADLLTVHLEADMPPGIQAALAAMERRGVRKGIALRPITAAEAVLPYLDKVDLILVMTVEPGFGGQAFMADQLPKIAAIRRYIQERNPACPALAIRLPSAWRFLSCLCPRMRWSSLLRRFWRPSGPLPSAPSVRTSRKERGCAPSAPVRNEMAAWSVWWPIPRMSLPWSGPGNTTGPTMCSMGCSPQ